MQELYESKISRKRWGVYGLFGDLGWLIYFIGTGRLLKSGVTALAVLTLLPAVLMLVGIVELLCERAAKLGAVLPKRRLYRGFGALTLGGICGTVCAVVVLLSGQTRLGLWLLCGGVLCAVFVGLLFREYHPVR